MDTYAAPGNNREQPAAMLSDSGALDRAWEFDPSPRETERRLSARASLGIMVSLSLALWALIWFCLAYLISHWP